MERRTKGTGSIYRRKGSKDYTGEITVHGERRTWSSPSRAKVEAWIAAEKAKAAPTEYTVASAAEAWMAEHISPRCRDVTTRNYRHVLDKYVLPVLGDMKAEDVTRGDVKRMIRALAASGKAANTMRLARALVHSLYEWLVDEEKVAANPCTRIPVPKTTREKRRALTQAEVNRLLAAMKGTRWLHAVRFILATGLRRGELLALQWSDIRDGWLYVERAISQYGVELTPKTATSIRRIKLGEVARGILQDQRNQLAAERIASEYIFPGEHGRPVLPNVLTVVVSKQADRHNIHATLHELRHTFATYALASNAIDLKTLQTMLGHATAAMTLDTYADMVPRNLEKAAEAVDDFAKALTSERSIVIPLRKSQG